MVLIDTILIMGYAKLPGADVLNIGESYGKTNRIPIRRQRQSAGMVPCVCEMDRASGCMP